jgi:signal transduction histidine kinase
MISSIRGRVLVFAMLAQMLATACAVSLAVWYVHRARWSSVDSDLQARAVSLLALVGQADDNPYALDFDGNQTSVPPGDLFYIVDPRGGPPLAGTPSWIGDENRFHRRAVNTWNFQFNGATYRGKALIETPILDQEDLKVPQLSVNLFYATPVARTQQQIAQTTRIAISVGIVAILVSAFLTWWAVGKGMAPLTELASRADKIQATHAEFDLPPGTLRSAELMPLGRALQSLATRVRAAFDRERQFLSDAAHELKTAVAIQKSTLQLLEQRNNTESEYREGIARALEDTARTERLVSDMLLLSRIEHAQNSLENPSASAYTSSLNESVQSAIDQLQSLARMKSVVIALSLNRSHRVAARESELILLWTNLIENAIQHSPPASQVRVEVSEASADTCRIQIADSGSGIAPADLPHIFERFYRSDSSRSRATGGFGLGLSIAKAIVDTLHGSILVESSTQGGTTVEVTLPKA